jgi:hypothetical protein
MTMVRRITSVIAAALLVVLGAGPAAAEEIKTQRLQLEDPALKTAETQAKWKKSTWEAYQRQRQTTLKAGSDSAEIPPTDCPPEPPKVCLDSWDDELTSK